MAEGRVMSGGGNTGLSGPGFVAIQLHSPQTMPFHLPHLHWHKHNEEDQDAAPPDWSAAPEQSHTWGLFSDAPGDEFEAGEKFCRENPMRAPRFLPSSEVDRIESEGCKAWGITNPPRFFKGTVANEVFQGHKGAKVIRVTSEGDCRDTCLMSSLPIMAGLYDIHGKEGVYFETKVVKMNGTVAIGMTCKPYPEFRLPGWNRGSAALHLDDFQKFFEDGDGGKDYDHRVREFRTGDIIGCGFEFRTHSLFYTLNGERLNTAFQGIFTPREQFDVYVAIGLGGPGENELVVNFGGDDANNLFAWKPGREWAWLVQGHVGKLTGGSAGLGSDLPTYEQASH